MAPISEERFKASMARSFRFYSDEVWGPIYGPGGPHMRAVTQSEPDPSPWRELYVAFEAVKMAEALELAAAGSGVTFLTKLADDPDSNWCGTRPPGTPPPRRDGGIDRAVFGAALDFVAAGVSNGDVARTARELGNEMLG